MTRLTQIVLTLSLSLLSTTASAQRHGRAQPDDGRSPMQRAMACRASASSEPARNRCIINALRGATTMQELGLLGSTLMIAGSSAEAVRVTRTYIERFPDGPLVPTFRSYLASHGARAHASRSRRARSRSIADVAPQMK